MRKNHEEIDANPPRPGPIGMAIRVALGIAFVYGMVELVTKWEVFRENDLIASDFWFITLLTLWLLPDVFKIAFRRSWGIWPTAVVIAGGIGIGVVGYLVSGTIWSTFLAGWVYAADLFVFGAFVVSFPIAIVARSPGCELGAIHWLIARARGEMYARPGCAIGLDRLDRLEAHWWGRKRTVEHAANEDEPEARVVDSWYWPRFCMW